MVNKMKFVFRELKKVFSKEKNGFLKSSVKL